MKSTIKQFAEDFSYPSEKEIRNAVKICCGRCCNACESPVEYALRKRKTDLSLLLDMAIERELTDREKSVIKSIYFDDSTVAATASEMGISSTAVYCAKSRAEDKLKKALEYVVIYQNGSEGKGEIFGEAFAVSAARREEKSALNERLSAIRKERAISLEKAGKAAGIEKSRLGRIERGETEAEASEIENLCRVYGVEIILKEGEKNGA